jgi:capsular exopolysaccharide synthesis family protein
VSRATLVRNRLVAALPERVEREAYRPLQGTVARRYLDDDMRVIGVTSPSDGGGKTLTAANLAISLALDARRSVMLIDLDLEAPGIQRLFEVDIRAGVEDCLFNGVPVQEALCCPAIEGLKLLPARGTSKNAARILRSSELAQLIESIRRSYPDDIVVLDLPSTVTEGDAEAFEALIDGMVLVVEDRVTEERDYRRALKSFRDHKLIGTVLNRVPTI